MCQHTPAFYNVWGCHLNKNHGKTLYSSPGSCTSHVCWPQSHTKAVVPRVHLGSLLVQKRLIGGR